MFPEFLNPVHCLQSHRPKPVPSAVYSAPSPIQCCSRWGEGRRRKFTSECHVGDPFLRSESVSKDIEKGAQ